MKIILHNCSTVKPVSARCVSIASLTLFTNSSSILFSLTGSSGSVVISVDEFVMEISSYIKPETSVIKLVATLNQVKTDKVI
jgi:hypothetical protein